MEILRVSLLACACLLHQADGRTTYGDIFPHKHSAAQKFPFPAPPIPGWQPDTNPWDDYLYPPLNSKLSEPMHHRGKPKVHLTSDSPALIGSNITFTAKLEYPPCQREDANGELVWDERCEDATELEASANGQGRSGYVYNWTSWLDDYGFGKCPDVKKCNVYPDGKPFPQSNDWRRKSYVYVWRTMGQYYEKCGGSSASVTINTTNIPLGAEVVEVMVYRKRERRKYTPLSSDSIVYVVTDKIPLVVDISQKSAVNTSVFVRGEDIVFKVKLHDPSGYLKTAAFVDFIWDFSDGNKLVTHRDVITHKYDTLGNMRVSLVVEAAFPAECAPTSATPTARLHTSPPHKETSTTPPITHSATTNRQTTPTPASTSQALTSSNTSTTSGSPTTEPLPSTDSTDSTESTTSPLPWLRARRLSSDGCFRYAYGSFTGNITIVEPKRMLNSWPKSRIVDVSAARVNNTDVNFQVKCLGSIPTSACTIVSDPGCSQVHSITCDDLPPSSECEVHLRRRFLEPGTYCVNITLENSSSMALASTTVTISKSQEPPAGPKTPNTAGVVLSTCAVIVAVFAFIGYLAYKRRRVYRPIQRTLVKDGRGRAGAAGHMVRLKESLFPSSEESRHLLTERHPL